MTTQTVSPTEVESEPDPFAAIAAELRKAAGQIETLAGSGLPKPAQFQFNIQPGEGGTPDRRDDDVTGRAVDAMAMALLGKPGEPTLMGSGNYFYSARGWCGPISVSIYQSVSTRWFEKRQAPAALAAKEAELAKLCAEVAELRAKASASRAPIEPGQSSCTCPLGPEDAHFPDCPWYVRPTCTPKRRLAHSHTVACGPMADETGLTYSRADTDADDPTPVSPDRVPLHTGSVVADGVLVTDPEPVVRHFSFGHGQTDPDTGESLLDKYATVVAPSVEACRAAMFASRYGDKWSFDYDPDSETWLEWGPRWTEHERIDATVVRPDSDGCE